VQTRFFMPNDNATFGRYYSLDLGPLHLVMTNVRVGCAERARACGLR